MTKYRIIKRKDHYIIKKRWFYVFWAIVERGNSIEGYQPKTFESIEHAKAEIAYLELEKQKEKIKDKIVLEL